MITDIGRGDPGDEGHHTVWRIPNSAIEASYAEMAADGERDREGIALWVGRRDARLEQVGVTHVLLLRGSGIVRERAFIQIAPELLNEVTDLVAELGDDRYLVGQIHGHPPTSSTDLSWSDITYGIRIPQYLSVVAPAYGMKRPMALRDCGIHVFETNGGWRRLSSAELDKRIHVDHEAPVNVIVVEHRPVDEFSTTRRYNRSRLGRT